MKKKLRSQKCGRRGSKRVRGVRHSPICLVRKLKVPKRLAPENFIKLHTNLSNTWPLQTWKTRPIVFGGCNITFVWHCVCWLNWLQGHHAMHPRFLIKNCSQGDSHDITLTTLPHNNGGERFVISSNVWSDWHIAHEPPTPVLSRTKDLTTLSNIL